MVGIVWMVRTPHPLGDQSEISARRAHGRLARRAVLRWLGYAATAAALIAIGFDLWVWRFEGALDFRNSADWWSTLHPESLQQFSQAVQGISQGLWDSAVNKVLRWPAFATMGGLGLFGMFMGRRRHHV
jgi:hypothetical protein